MLHQSVVEVWHRFSEPLEGRVDSMYLDIKGLVTCAVGILIDPLSLALPLPWRRVSGGEKATREEITAAWTLLKSHQEYSRRSTKSARALTGLYLDEGAIDAVVARKLEDNAASVRAHYFPRFDEFPADAQLGLMSMAWAVGAAFPLKFPTFRAAVERGDWMAARAACTIREEGNPGVVPRNIANRVCFANAEIVERYALARDILRWPNVAQATVHPTDPLVAETITEASMHALEVTRLSGLREMAGLEDPNDEETTVKEGKA